MAPAAHLLQELRPGRPLAEGDAGRHAFLTNQLGHFQSGHAAVSTQAIFLSVERESELRLLDGGNPHVAERPVADGLFRHSAYSDYPANHGQVNGTRVL